MGRKVQEHHEKDTKKPLTPARNAQDQAAVHGKATSAYAIQRAMDSPQALSAGHLLAIHPMAGNRAVQRLVDVGVVQRHLDEEGRQQAAGELTDHMATAHSGTVPAWGTTQVSGNRVTVTGEWL
jgi:hypothetical protein